MPAIASHGASAGWHPLRLQRRGKLFRRLDFFPPIPCDCGNGNLVVLDHHHPLLGGTGRTWRYEVTCDACLICDPDGYRTQRDVLVAYNDGR